MANINAKGKQGCTALSVAALFGSCAALRMLIDFGSEINTLVNINRAPLHVAANNGDLESIELLIEAKS